MSDGLRTSAPPQDLYVGRIGIVVIGRNEAPRLGRALDSVIPQSKYIVYVDSGSSDGSAEIAQDLGVQCIRLTEGPCSAARGRGVGFERLMEIEPSLEFVQFLDGDCSIAAGWIEHAIEFMDANPDVGVVVGRLREENSDSLLLARLVAVDWDLPVGATDVIGGISLMRTDALASVGGWRHDLVAGEELDLSSRLRTAGYKLHRLDREMCRHDVGIVRFAEYWKRCVRTGHSYAQLAFLRQASSPPRWRRRALGSLFYGILLPIAGVLGLFWSHTALWVVTAMYAMLIARVAHWRRRRGDEWGFALVYALVTAMCKSAAGFGVLRFAWSRMTGRASKLIEYKTPGRSASAPGRGR